MVLDRTDFEIITLLQNNARLSNKEISSHINLAPSSCLERVRKLERAGYFQGFHARLNAEAVGAHLQALIYVQLAKHTHKNVEVFRIYTIAIPEVRQMFHVAGKDDFVLHVWLRDSNHLRELTMNAFTTWQEVSHIETHLIFEHVEKSQAPVFL